jgi:hypothetical protein
MDNGPSLSFPLMEDSVVNIRPKLLKEVRSGVDRYIRQPKLIRFAEGAFLTRVVKAGDARGRTRAEDLGSIEGLVATII